MQNKKIAILFSGGLDSSATLVKALEKHDRENIELFFFDYMQNTRKEERDAVVTLAVTFKVKYNILTLENMDMFLDCSLTSGENDQGEPGYSSYVPNRNLLFLTLLSNICLIRGYDIIYSGFQHKLGKTGETIKGGTFEERVANTMATAESNNYEEVLHPDQSLDFIFGAMNLIYLSSGGKVKLEVPLMNMDKVDILSYLESAGALKEINELSYTCYNPDAPMNDWGKGCGECTSCDNRRKAFAIFKNNYGGKI